MARGRGERQQVDIWPGFVDALSTLLLAIIFLLVVFVLGQFFLGQVLQTRDQTVGRLQGEVQDLTGRLELEQDSAAELRQTLSRLNADLAQAFGERDDLGARLGLAESERETLGERVASLTDEQAQVQAALDNLRGEQGRTAARRDELEAVVAGAQDAVAADKATIELQLAQLVQLQRDVETLRQVRGELEGRVAELSQVNAMSEADRQKLAGELGTVRDRASTLEARVATSEERTVLAQREVGERDLRLEDLARQSTTTVSDRDSAVAEVRSLQEQIGSLNEALARLNAALDLKEGEAERQSAEITDLDQRLSLALASRVEELSRSRSEFFGRLRQALGDRQDVQIVGDRFVFQSEVLFDSGSAELNPSGQEQLARLAATFREIIGGIPEELPWVLQVDGHTDRIPINTPRFPSNWELSSARAISVAQDLIAEGIPADRVAARGFAEFQPLDPGTSPEAFSRNRRIEIKLTTR